MFGGYNPGLISPEGTSTGETVAVTRAEEGGVGLDLYH